MLMAGQRYAETKNGRDQKQDVQLLKCVLLMKCFAKSFQRGPLYLLADEKQRTFL